MGIINTIIRLLGETQDVHSETGVKPLNIGEELKIELTGMEKHKVTVQKIGTERMLVRELFHGTYTIDYKDIMFVYDGPDGKEDIVSRKALMERAMAHRRRCGMYVPGDAVPENASIRPDFRKRLSHFAPSPVMD